LVGLAGLVIAGIGWAGAFEQQNHLVVAGLTALMAIIIWVLWRYGP
jgi:hypothetical protein